MMKRFLTAILCAGLLAETAVPVIAATSRHHQTRRHRSHRNRRSGRRRARNVGIGAAGGAAAGALIGGGRGAGAGALIGGTAGAVTPTRRRHRRR